jgi:hypothetical protein
MLDLLRKLCSIGLLALAARLLPASEHAATLQHELLARLAAGADVPVLFRTGPGAPQPALLRSADERDLQVVIDGASADLRWSALTGDDVYAMFTPSAGKAEPGALIAFLELGLAGGHVDERPFLKALDDLRLLDTAAATTFRSRLAQAFRPQTAAVASPGAPAPAAGRAKPSRARYAALAHPGDLATMDERLGPRAKAQPGAKPETVPIAPMLRMPFGNKPLYNFGTPAADPGNYWSTQGQVLYIPDQRQDAGVDRITVGAYSHHALQFTPVPAWWGGSHPEPGVLDASWRKLAGGDLGQPFAIERAYSSFSENGFMIFTSGLIGAGAVNNVNRYPCFRFPPDKWPTALALTNKNEFLLVAVWDARMQQAQLAVLALGLRDKGKVGSCLPSWGIHNLVKLLGYVDLPGLELPTAMACTAASNPRIPAPFNAFELDYGTAEKRQARLKDPQIASAGYAVVVSKTGNKAAFVDLQPLFAGVRRHCFTTAELAAKASGFGEADAQWPYTFQHDPAMRPVLVTTIDVPAPTAVRTSMQAVRDRPAVAAIACEQGEVRVFRVGALLTEAPATAGDVQPHAVIPVGRNPVAMSYQRQGDRLRPEQGTGAGSWSTINYVFLVACRGDREIDWIEITADGGTCYRRFRDSRLVDPVHVQQMRTNSGNEGYVFTVCDFQGRKVVNYRLGPVHVDRKDIPAPDGAGIECTGWLDLPGHPFQVSTDNVP